MLLLAGPPFFYSVSRLLQHVRWLDSGDVLIAVMGAWMVAFAVALFRWQWFRCPRCDAQFHQRGLFSNVLSSRCLNCGFPKWEEPPDRSKRT